jgi:predicted esterase
MMRPFVALLLALSMPLPAVAAVSPVLSARPSASAPGLPSGRTMLANGAIAYLPASAVEGRLPLVVLLHGAGGRADRFLDRFVTEADRGGFLLLALQSKASTWDLVPRRDGGGGPLAMKSGPVMRFGADVARIDAALTELYARVRIDTRRSVLLGFSDGASYALSLGLANPQLFASIIALSPGFVTIPARIAPAQRIFIAHGRHDQVLPFQVAEKDIAGLLIANGLKPQFRPFDGDHRIDNEALADGMAYALGGVAPRSGL